MGLFLFLLIAGWILIATEIFVPGGVLGVIGTILLIISAFICFKMFGVRIGVYYFVALIAGGAIVAAVLMQIAPKLPFRKGLSLETSEKGVKVEIENLKNLMGKTGTAYTVLRPTGRIQVDGKRYEATTEGAYIKQGEPVEVYRIDGNNLIVRQKQA